MNSIREKIENVLEMHLDWASDENDGVLKVEELAESILTVINPRLIPVEKIDILFSCCDCDHETRMDIGDIIHYGPPLCDKCLKHKDISVTMDYNPNALVAS